MVENSGIWEWVCSHADDLRMPTTRSSNGVNVYLSGPHHSLLSCFRSATTYRDMYNQILDVFLPLHARWHIRFAQLTISLYWQAQQFMSWMANEFHRHGLWIWRIHGEFGYIGFLDRSSLEETTEFDIFGLAPHLRLQPTLRSGAIQLLVSAISYSPLRHASSMFPSHRFLGKESHGLFHSKPRDIDFVLNNHPSWYVWVLLHSTLE